MCRFFFVKQKTAYEVRISDWSSDVCSSDLLWSREPALVKAAQKRQTCLPERSRHRGKITSWTSPLRSSCRLRSGNPVSKIGRAACRERVCQYVSISVVAGTLKKKNITYQHLIYNTRVTTKRNIRPPI